MNAARRVVRARPGPRGQTADPPRSGIASRVSGASAGQTGVLSLEAVFLLPILAVLVLGLVETASLLRDVLVVHDAARSGARAAATSSGVDEPSSAARGAAPGLRLGVTVVPEERRTGDLVTVTVTTERRLGPMTHRVTASAVARVEPIVGRSRAPSTPPVLEAARAPAILGSARQRHGRS